MIKAFVDDFQAISMVNIWKRIAKKLLRIILLHFVLVAFSISLGENPKTAHFHDLRILGCVPEAQNQYDLSVATPGYFKDSKKSPNHLKQILFVEASNMKDRVCL